MLLTLLLVFGTNGFTPIDMNFNIDNSAEDWVQLCFVPVCEVPDGLNQYRTTSICALLSGHWWHYYMTTCDRYHQIGVLE